MKKIILALLLPSLVYAGHRSDKIQKWDEILPQKGYILSLDLQNEKMCSKIWTAQIKDFKTMNPHIKDPNIILVNQKIKVQDCRIQIEEVVLDQLPDLEEKQDNPSAIAEKPQWFIGAFGGLNSLGSISDDTSKNGYNLGVKIGKKIKLDEKTLSIAGGSFYNKSKTKDENNSLGAYEISTTMFFVEGSFLSNLSDKIQLGPKLMIVTGRDISLEDKQQGKALGAYAGAEGLYKLSNKVDLELNLQQRLDDLSRVNVMGNLGVRLSF